MSAARRRPGTAAPPSTVTTADPMTRPPERVRRAHLTSPVGRAARPESASQPARGRHATGFPSARSRHQLRTGRSWCGPFSSISIRLISWLPAVQPVGGSSMIRSSAGAAGRRPGLGAAASPESPVWGAGRPGPARRSSTAAIRPAGPRRTVVPVASRQPRLAAGQVRVEPGPDQAPSGAAPYAVPGASAGPAPRLAQVASTSRSSIRTVSSCPTLGARKP